MAQQYSIIKNITIEVKKSNEISINNSSKTYPYYSLFLLSLFDKPQFLQNIGSLIKAKTRDKIEILKYQSTLHTLISDGILINNSDNINVKKADTPTIGDWGSQSIHISMLNDTYRTHSFEKAISKSVKGKNVIDIGCGTGILSLFAARHGAKHVYAIDSDPKCIKYTENMVSKNNLEDKITVIHKSCFDLEIDEKCDVLISEVIGNTPLGEDILNIFSYSKKRLLKEKHLTIPSNLSIYAVPINYDHNKMGNKFYSNQNISDWNDFYKFNFAGLIKPKVNSREVFFLKQEYLKSINLLGEGTLIEEFNFTSKTISSKEIEKNISFNIDSELEISFNGILLYFNSDLIFDESITTNPKVPNNNNSWKYTIYPLNEKSIKVNHNQTINFKVKSDQYNRDNYIFELLSEE